MSAEADIAQIALPLFQAFQPATFLERGVAVPFTTPALAGARARPAERGGTEILMRNPSGGRGLYILPWGGIRALCRRGGIRALCRPTVHDMMLNRRVEALPGVTPEAIRVAARAVAAEGLAGREAASAASATEEAERTEHLITNYQLLLALMEQVAPAGLPGIAAAAEDDAEALKARARRAAARIAPEIGRTPEAVADALEELAPVFAGIGVPRQLPPPRLIRLLLALRRLREAMLAWKDGHDADADSAAGAAMIAAVAEVTLACAEQTLAAAHDLTRDMPALLRRWHERPAEVAGLASRPAWLLDGWEQICLIWRQAGTEPARRAAVLRIALLVPAIPREGSAWVGAPVETEFVWRFRRTVRRNEDWRTGALLDLIAANERLRAMAV